MAYLIKGPVPTVALGDCPWCDKKNTVLHLMAAMLDRQLCGDYVCAKCLLLLDQSREEHPEEALRNNPEVEVRSP